MTKEFILPISKKTKHSLLMFISFVNMAIFPFFIYYGVFLIDVSEAYSDESLKGIILLIIGLLVTIFTLVFSLATIWSKYIPNIRCLTDKESAQQSLESDGKKQ